MSGFPPPSSPEKNLSNLYKSPFEDDSSSDKEKTSANKQTGSDQKTAQTKQNSWAAGNTQKTPSLQSKPSKTSLNLRQGALEAQPDGNPLQTHTPPITSPRIGARGQQQSVSTNANSSSTQVPKDHQDADALTSLLMNSASAVHIRTSSTVTTTTTTTDTASSPVNTTTTTTTTRPADSVTGDDVIRSGDKASTKERRLKKTEKQTGVSAATGAAINGADLSPGRMAKFLIKAATQDGKLTATPVNVKIFMRENFGKINGKSAQTCFKEFMAPLLASSELDRFYKTMAKTLLTINKEKNGEETSLIQKLDVLCKREGFVPKEYTNDPAIQELIEPVINPLFDYLNDIDGSIANSKLPAALLEFMIEFDREIVKWYRKTSGMQSVATGEEKSKSANSISAPDEKDLNIFRRNAQVALLGVKGIDGHLGAELSKNLEKLSFQSHEGTGGILKNFNSCLGRLYSKKCDTLIDGVMSATDDDLKSIRERRFEEEKKQIIGRAEKKFSQTSGKSNKKQSQFRDRDSDSQEEVIAETTTKTSPGSGLSLLSVKQLHQLEEKNEQLVDSFFDKYPTLNKFHVVISKIMRAMEAGYTKLGKSPSEKELQQIAVDAIGEEIRIVEDKIRMSTNQTAQSEQTATKAELEVLMGQILFATEHNPFDQ